MAQTCYNPTIGKSDLDLGSGQWGLVVKSPTDRLWSLSRDWMGDAWSGLEAGVTSFEYNKHSTGNTVM